MIKFNINNRFNAKQLEVLTPQRLSSILATVAYSARAQWIKIASNDQSHLKAEYLDSIQPVQVNRLGGIYSISLVGELAHVIEDGAPKLDMRTTLLGPNVPIGERGKHINAQGGFYRAIPFRHKVKDIGNLYIRAGMNKEGIAAVRSMAKTIRAEIKTLKPSLTMPGSRKTLWGERLGKGYAPKLKSWHKTDIYQGMVRLEKTYEKATQNQYMTFRTISTTVTTGWYRRPIAARHYADKVSEYVGKMIPKAIDAFVTEVMGAL